MNPKAISKYMYRKVETSGYVKNFSGELEKDSYARVPLPGTCNASGGETIGYYRKGSSRHLLIMFMGGGLSWNADTAKYNQNPETITGSKIPALYAPAVDVITEFSMFALTKRPGILTVGPENPFSDWNVAVINYVTGDFHIGNSDFPYIDLKGNQQILHHKGYYNFQLALAKAKLFFPTADKLLIAGGSAGAFAAPALAPEVMAAYPECKDVTIFSDSAFLQLECYRQVAEKIWNAPQNLIAAIHTNDILVDWFQQLYSLKGDSICYLYANSYRDYLLTTFQNYIDTGSYSASKQLCRVFTKNLSAHIERLQKACPDLHFHINDLKAAAPGAKGTEHCLLLNENFFKPVQKEPACVDWLSEAVKGHCNNVGLHLLDNGGKPSWKFWE